MQFTASHFLQRAHLYDVTTKGVVVCHSLLSVEEVHLRPTPPGVVDSERALVRLSATRVLLCWLLQLRVPIHTTSFGDLVKPRKPNTSENRQHLIAQQGEVRLPIGASSTSHAHIHRCNRDGYTIPRSAPARRSSRSLWLHRRQSKSLWASPFRPSWRELIIPHCSESVAIRSIIAISANQIA